MGLEENWQGNAGIEVNLINVGILLLKRRNPNIKGVAPHFRLSHCFLFPLFKGTLLGAT